MHDLISQDITKQEAELARYKDELLKLQKKGFLQRNTEEIVR